MWKIAASANARTPLQFVTSKEPLEVRYACHSETVTHGVSRASFASIAHVQDNEILTFEQDLGKFTNFLVSIEMLVPLLPSRHSLISKTKIGSHQCPRYSQCWGPFGWGLGIPIFVVGALFRLPCNPILLCCPGKLSEKFSLELTRDAVISHSAINDCALHIATDKQTLPLDKINDVQAKTDCWLSIFGLKLLQIQSQGTNDVLCGQLVDSEMAREAILLATKQYKERALAPGGQAMSRDHLSDRLVRLNKLVADRVLTAAEASKYKSAILAATSDPTDRFMEAQSLKLKGLVSEDEFLDMKQSILRQIAV